MGRLIDLQDITNDHEHCLQHHAEEIGTRATKYDLVVCQQRIDRCAVKERVDAQHEELQKMLEWQTAKMSNMGFGGDLGGEAFAMEADDDIANNDDLDPDLVGVPSIVVEADRGLSPAPGAASAGDRAPSPSSPSNARSKRSMSILSVGGSVASGQRIGAGAQPFRNRQQAGQAESAPLILLQQQMESLAQGVLGLAHAALRQPVLGLSRQVRVDREMSLLDHLKSVLHWVTHRKAPHYWDPVKLTSLALECAQFSEEEKKRALTIHATARTLEAGQTGKICASWPKTLSASASTEAPLTLASLSEFGVSCSPSTQSLLQGLQEATSGRELTLPKKKQQLAQQLQHPGIPNRHVAKSKVGQCSPLIPQHTPATPDDATRSLIGVQGLRDPKSRHSSTPRTKLDNGRELPPGTLGDLAVQMRASTAPAASTVGSQSARGPRSMLPPLTTTGTDGAF